MAFTERLALVVQVVTDRAHGQIEKLGTSVDRLGGRAQQTLGRFQGALDRVGLGGTRAALAVESLGAAAATGGTIAVGALSAAVAKGVNDFVSLAAQVREFKQLSGASAEEASRFVAVLDDFGISSETGANALFRLGRNVAANASALDRFGVAVARSEDGTVDLTATVLNVADAYTRIEDPARRAELVQAAFGRGGAALIPILEQGRKGLDEFFASAEQDMQLLSDEDLAKAREYELALDNLGDATSGLSREIGSGAVPALSDFANALASVVRTADDITSGQLDKVFGAFTVVSPLGAFAQVKDALGELTGGNEEAAAATEDATEATEAQTDALEENASASKGAASAVRDHARAQLDQRSAALGVESAQAKLRDAHDAVAEAAGAEARKAAELADAQRGLRDANEGVADAERALADARQRATRDLRDATQARREAAEELGDAQENAAAAAIRFGAGSEEAEDAQIALERATIRNADAVDDLNRLEAEREHPRIVADAEDRLADAKRRVADAQERVNEVLKREPVDEMRDAQRQLEEAVLAVEQALLRQTEAWRSVLSTTPRTSTAPQPGPAPEERIGVRSASTTVTNNFYTQNLDPVRAAQEIEYALGGRGI